MAHRKHVLVGGQSLAQGSHGVPSLSVSSMAVNARLCLPDGTIEGELKTTGSQMPMYSLGYRLANSDPDSLWIFSTHASSGKTLARLSKGGDTGVYEAMLATIQAAYDEAIAAGDTYEVVALYWIQGEADQVFDVSFEAYRAGFVAYDANFQADTAAVQAHAEPIPIYLSQTATWAYYGIPARIGLAQLELARTIPHIHLTNGQYQYPYDEGLHMENLGYYWLGETGAFNHIIPTAPFAPNSVAIDGNDLVLTFDVPVGDLEFDTTTVAAQPNMGFSVDGTSRSIASVAITGADEVTVTLDGPVTEYGAKVGYGVAYGTGPGLGNLCDGQVTTSILAGHTTHRLANWAAQFNDPIPVEQTEANYFHVTRMLQYAAGSYYEITIPG